MMFFARPLPSSATVADSLSVCFPEARQTSRMSLMGRWRCDQSDRFQTGPGHDRTLANGGFAAT